MAAGENLRTGDWKIFFPGVLLLLFLSFQAKAQVLITGKVTDDKTNLPLYPATILDKTTGHAVYADSLGNYQITVQNGDELEYRYLGFYPEKYKVPAGLTRIIYDVALISKREKLKTVEVQALTPYQQDSLDRIKTFKHYLDQPVTQLMDKNQHSLYEKNTEDNGTNTHNLAGFGFTFHPLTFFSKKERRKRRFHKMYEKFEKKAFIDSRYTQKLVHKLTGLQGDSLRLFISHHRPPYDFTRRASDLVFWSWIKRQYKEWLEEASERERPK
jgi:hypothetical protein